MKKREIKRAPDQGAGSVAAYEAPYETTCARRADTGDRMGHAARRQAAHDGTGRAAVPVSTPEIGHGIDKLAAVAGLCCGQRGQRVSHWLPSAEGACAQTSGRTTRGLYQVRPTNSPPRNEGVELVQLVSFGCGMDAITTDEMRKIIEDKGQDIYTNKNR